MAAATRDALDVFERLDGDKGAIGKQPSTADVLVDPEVEVDT